MTREEAVKFLTDISYDLGTVGIEYLTVKDGKKMREAIEALSAEPQKMGQWICHHIPYTWLGWTTWSCSECAFYTDNTTNYCPNCGAKIAGSEESNANSN